MRTISRRRYSNLDLRRSGLQIDDQPGYPVQQ
jgi:hypothetical protein